MNKLSIGAVALGLSAVSVLAGGAQAAGTAQCVAVGAGRACNSATIAQAPTPSTTVADAAVGQGPAPTAPASYYPNYGLPKHPGGR
jgi:hypothetical protein